MMIKKKAKKQGYKKEKTRIKHEENEGESQ